MCVFLMNGLVALMLEGICRTQTTFGNVVPPCISSLCGTPSVLDGDALPPVIVYACQCWTLLFTDDETGYLSHRSCVQPECSRGFVRIVLVVFVIQDY